MNTIKERNTSVKTAYAIILTNNTRWVSGQQFECGKAKLMPLERGHLHQLPFIISLLLIWLVGHLDPQIFNWVTEPRDVTKEFRQATYHFECNTLTYWAIGNTLLYATKW